MILNLFLNKEYKSKKYFNFKIYKIIILLLISLIKLNMNFIFNYQ